MTQPSVEPAPKSAAALDLGSATPQEVADLLLWALVESRRAISIMPRPAGGTHSIVSEREGASSPLASVPSNVGDAVVARLAILAGLTVGAPGAQLGRLRVRTSAPAVESSVTSVLVAVRTTPAGLEAELHRVGETSTHEGGEGAPPESLTVGRGRVGMYRICGLLGHGGMGVVYLAEHVALEKEVALKVLHAEAARDPTLAAQFLVEARAACRARHPGIVDVTDFGSLADGRTYLVMERIVWPTLAALLTRTLGPLPLSRALAIARNVAEALAAAAAHGVVHRDLTPTNIFVADDDRTKIADFGLARIEGHDPASQQSPGALGGTAGYMSPEQWLGERADTRSDIYSLGVVLFRTITGQMPFPTRDPLELLDQQMSAPVPMAHGEHGPVPPQVQQLLERAMAARQAERFQTVDELLLALRALEGALAPSGWTRWQ